MTLEGAPTPTATEGDDGTEPQAPAPTTTAPGADKLQAEVEKWKNLSRENEKKAKANAEAAQKYADLEESQKSDSQKLTDQLAKTGSRVMELEAELLKERVARRHGLTDPQMQRLIGSTEEELEADAVEFLAMLKGDEEEEEQEEGEVETNGHRQPPGTPKPLLKSGAKPPVGLNDDKMLASVKAKLGIK